MTHFSLIASQCFCGNVIDNGNVYATNQSGCDYPCSGGPDICGGLWYISMWKKESTAPQTPTPAPMSTTVIGNFHYMGCYTDDPYRALTAKSESSNAMTNTLCAEYCRGFKFFATEYGKLSNFWIIFYILFTCSLLEV